MYGNKLRLHLALLCALQCWIAFPASAAKVSCSSFYTGKGVQLNWSKMPTPNLTCLVGLIEGPIERGDYERVSAFLRQNHPYVGGFNLISTGGDIEEAMKIGRTLRRYLLSTVSSVRYHYENGERFEDEQPFLSHGVKDICRGETCVCASACALIWIGGVTRLGMIGLHRPRTEEAGFRLLSPADASVLYHKVLDRMITYMKEMEAPQSLVEATIVTPSGDIRWVDDSETGLYESPSIAEWIAASCGLEDPLQDARNPSRLMKQLICGSNLKLSSRARLDPP